MMMDLFQRGIKKVHRCPCLGRNLILDRLAQPIHLDKLRCLEGITVSALVLDLDEYFDTINTIFPSWQSVFKSVWHKKLLEFFTTYKILKVQDDHVMLDAAGGQFSYIEQLQTKAAILHDITIPRELRDRLSAHVKTVESDASRFPFEDQSIDRISCHHSFEHFQQDSDYLFIREVQRILRVGGKCCIVPIFFSDCFMEVTDVLNLRKKFSFGSKLLIDPTATLPGGSLCGNYARIYSLEAFSERILGAIDFRRFSVTLLELRMNRKKLPDLSLSCHKGVSGMNSPYRALVIERLAIV